MKKLILNGQEIKNLLWIQTAFLGDIVLNSAAFAFVRENFPGVRQFLVTTPLGQQVYQDESLDGIFVFDKRNEGVISSARRIKNLIQSEAIHKNNSCILQVHLSFRTSCFATLLGLPRICYEEASFAFFAVQKIPRLTVFHESHRILLLMEPLGVDRKALLQARPKLKASNDHDVGLLCDGRLGPILHKSWIGIAPGSVWGTKRWGEENFIQLIDQLISVYPQHQILILGDKNEIPQINMLRKKFSNTPQITDLVGATSIIELKSIISRLNILVANDSAPVHFASAFNIPTVAIFGATVPSFGFYPVAERSVSLGLDGLTCRPCHIHGPMTCPLGHFKCMRDLKPELVLKSVRELLTV